MALLPWDKPFLAPLFAFLSNGGPGACLELLLFVRTVMQLLLTRIRERRSYPRGVTRKHRGAILRVNAAEGRAVGIGGCLPAQDEQG